MDLSIDTKMDVLKTVMQEDRSEIRLIKDRINSICMWITASSFAVTSFLLDPKLTLKTAIGWPFLLLIDVAFLLLLWVIFIRLMIDLRSVRRCLDVREEMIRTVADPKQEKFDPFPTVDMGKRPNISENGLLWIAGVASLALMMKLVIVYRLLQCQGA